MYGGYNTALARILVPLQMMIPAIVVLMIIIWQDGDFANYGLIFGGLKYYILAYFLMVGYHFVHSLISAGLGLGRFVEITEGLGGYYPGMEMPPAQLLYMLAFISAPLQNLILGLGEEFGWRGYLLNRLMAKGLRFTIITGGLIWGVWHAPVILLGHNFPGRPVLGMLLMVVVAIPFNAVFTWFRLKSGSVVVVGFAKGVFNATIFLGGVFYTTADAIFVNPVGLIGLPLLTLLAISLFKFFPPDLERFKNLAGIE